jgi:hypothetical protein
MKALLFLQLKGHYFLPLFPQFFAPTFRHLTKAPLAYAEGQTEYLAFTFLVQASFALPLPKGISVFTLAVAGVRSSGATWASPKILTSPITGTEFASWSSAVMAGPEGFPRGG